MRNDDDVVQESGNMVKVGIVGCAGQSVSGKCYEKGLVHTHWRVAGGKGLPQGSLTLGENCLSGKTPTRHLGRDSAVGVWERHMSLIGA